MRRKLMVVFSLLVMLTLPVTVLYAANVRITNVSFSLGSLIANGNMAGFDPNQLAKVQLQANGIATVFCRPKVGGLLGPYQVNAVSVGGQSFRANGAGLHSFHIETGSTTLKNFSCPSGTRPEIHQEVWRQALITVKSPTSSTPLLQQSYHCSQNGDVSIRCWPDDDDDDDS